MNEVEQPGRGEIADRRQHEQSQDQRRHRRLQHDAIDLVGTVGADEAGDEHAHAGVERADEDDDDENDLPADADGGVGGEADEVSDQRVIDDALETTDHVLQHGRPGDLPDGVRDRTVDQTAVVPALGRDVGHGTEVTISRWLEGTPGAVMNPTRSGDRRR